MIPSNSFLDEAERQGSVVECSDIPRSFVYQLLYKGEVVYVGQTSNGLSRPLQHEADKLFTAIRIIRCPFCKLDETESYFILKYNPKYNRELSRLNYDSLRNVKNKLLKEHGIRMDLRKIRRIVRDSGLECISYQGKEYILKSAAKEVMQNIAAGRDVQQNG